MIYRAELTLDSTVCLALQRAAGNESDTLRFVPGTAVRGALARQCLEERAPESAEFRALFLDHPARFGCLRIEGADVWPLSARMCREAGDDHIEDRLVGEAAGEAYEEKCRCGAKWDIARGYTRYENRRGRAGYRDQEVRTRRVAHTAIDAKRLAARNSQFYSLLSIEAQQRFLGTIEAEGAAERELLRLLKAGEGRIRIGRGRSRGKGESTLRLTELEDRSEFRRESIEELQRFAARFQRLKGKRLFSVTLQSPALVVDEFLSSRSWIEPRDVGLSGEWELLNWYSESIRLPGWMASANVPRTEAVAIAPGSCFLFGTKGPADVESLLECAERVERGGVGERLEEGFGEAICCYEFHAKAGRR